MEFKFVIMGRPISWKNAKKIAFNRATKKSFITADKECKQWMHDAILQLRFQWRGQGPIPKHIELNAAIVSYLGASQHIDSDNLYGGPMDALQRAGVLKNDSCIRRHDGSDRRYDKENPRVEILLTEL